MVHLTQLIYLHPGKEADFDAFEAVAIPLIRKYGGTMELRLRPSAGSAIEAAIELPYEVHLVSFPSEEAFQLFASDEERKRVLHLKESSVRSVLLRRS